MAKKKVEAKEETVVPKSELVCLYYGWEKELLIDTIEVDPMSEVWVTPKMAEALLVLYPDRFKKLDK